MALIDKRHSDRFIHWEKRSRGWDVFPFPVRPEPPFAVFPREVPPFAAMDEGRRPTFLSSLVRAVSRTLATKAPSLDAAADPETEAGEHPQALEREELIELPLFLPPTFNARGPELAQFLESLSACAEPVAFELMGTAASVTAHLAVGASDAPHVRGQLRAFFPDLASAPVSGGLAAAWDAAGEWAGAVEFGLAREVMLPLASFGGDLCVPLVGALAELYPGECGVFQVIFEPVSQPWAEHMARAVGEDGGVPFVNAPELAGGVRQKTSRPLFGAVVRIATRGGSEGRAFEIARNMASALRVFANIGGNELVPLRNDGYPFEEHIDDVPLRRSRRAGMLLNSDELLGLVRFPTAAVRAAKFLRQARTTKAAPESASRPDGILVGLNEHAGEAREVRLSADQRTRHVHLVGASGTGKSTLLLNMIRGDIEAGQGLAVLDPHGDLIDRILGAIPPERAGDVVLLDPADEASVVGFNVLAAHSDWEKNLLAADLVAIFRRLSTSWGDQMNSVLGKAILAFLESERGGTLADLRRFLLEPAYRGEFLSTVRDPEVTYYWRKAFPQLTGNKSVGPIVTRLETFLGPKAVRHMVSQPGNRLDFARMMDEGKIFLGRLSKGVIGDDNAHLLGSLLVAKFQQAAMARQRQAAGDRRDFWLYADEFAEFITPSMAEILSGARKYRLGLTLAHQSLHQLQREPDVAGAVMTNCYARIVFRVSDQDARALERDFSAFEARDLQNLATGQAVARFERSECDFNLTVPQLPYPDEAEAEALRAQARALSNSRYASPRAVVEAEALARARAETEAEAKAEGPPPARPRRPPPPPRDDPPPPPAAPAPVAPPAPPPPSGAPAAPPTVEGASESDAPGNPKADTAAAPKDQATGGLPADNQPPPSAPSATQAEPMSKDAGRGGNEHKLIQKRIREAAQALGFRADIEKSVGKGIADVALARGELSIACEITVTNTVDQEVGHVARSLAGGFGLVAIISREAVKRERIREAAISALGSQIAEKVRAFSPDDFLAFLRELPPPAPPTPAPPRQKQRLGWKVTTTGPAQPASSDEQTARTDTFLKTVWESGQKRKRKKS